MENVAPEFRPIPDVHTISREFELVWEEEQRQARGTLEPRKDEIEHVRVGASPQYLALKRVTDILGALVGIAVFLPVLVPAVILIKITSRGSVFFTQYRAGKHGKPFKVYKLRTMRNGAEREKQKLLILNEQDGPAFKIKRDPRITRIGRLLRKTSLDEFPQFFNVLLGDMSIVGPRPFQLDEAAQFTWRHRQRELVKPGITCYWQVEGRNRLRFEQWMEKDLRYVRRCGFRADVDILIRTFKAVLECGGM